MKEDVRTKFFHLAVPMLYRLKTYVHSLFIDTNIFDIESNPSKVLESRESHSQLFI